MSDSNLTKHPELVHIGPCTFGLQDDNNDILYVVGKVDNIRFAKLDSAPTYMTEIVNGQQVESSARETECKYRLRGKFTETHDPNTQYLFLKNCGTPTVDDECGIASITEVHQAFKGRSIKVDHSNGFYGTGILPPIQSLFLDSVAFVGSTITPRTYHVVVVPVYGDTEGEADEDSVAVGLNEGLLIDWAMPLEGAPDTFRIYVYDDGDVIDNANLVGETSSTSIFLTDLTDLGDFPGEATGSFTITDMDDVAYTAGDDYNVGVCGVIAFPTTGSIPDGERVKITYSYRINQSVTMSIGPSVANSNPRLYHPVLLSMKDDDRNPPSARGIQIDLWKVMGLTGGWEWNLSDLNFDSGFEFEWAVLMDESTLNHGEIVSFNRHFENYEIVDWSTLSKWGSADACEEAAS